MMKMGKCRFSQIFASTTLGKGFDTEANYVHLGGTDVIFSEKFILPPSSIPTSNVLQMDYCFLLPFVPVK